MSYKIGDIVYLKTDEEQKERIITSYVVYAYETLYNISCGTENSSHYDFELTKEINELKKVK